MRRRKLQIYISAAWVLVLVAAVVGIAWYVTAHSMEPERDDARAYQLGQVVGVLLAAGLIAIWFDVYVRFIRFLQRKFRRQD